MSDALKQSLDLSMFWEYRAILLQGLIFNALVFLCAASVALSVGLGAALLRINRFWPMRWIGTLHVEMFRNAPDYIMLVWVHFVLPLLIGMVIRRRVEFHPFVSAVIALGFVYSGYFAEAFRAGIQAIPQGNLDAGRAFGMSERLILWRITLPQVVRRMLPEALNLFISMFKATTIVSLIAVPDLMYNVSMVIQQEMRPLPLYTGAALTYFLIIFLLSSRRARTSANAGAARSWRERRWATGNASSGTSATSCSPGLGVTVEVCAIAFAAAIVGGLVLCLMRLYVAPLRPVAILLIEFFRDTPIFVQLMWVAYVWPEVFGFPNTFFTAGWLALALQSSGYLAETFRAGIEAVPRGQRDAAFSAGMSQTQTFSRIVMPQVLLRVRAVDRQSVHRDREIIDPDLGHHRAGPDVAVAEAGERLVRADRNPHRDRGDLHRLRLSGLGGGKFLADRLRLRYGLAAS